MGIVTVHQIHPHSGAFEQTLRGLRSVSKKLGAKGTQAKVLRVVLGEGTGDFFLHNIYDSLTDFTVKMEQDGPDSVNRLLEKTFSDSKHATIYAPQLWRLIYSGRAGGEKPLVVQKQYVMPYVSLQGFIELSARIEDVVSQFGADIRASVPMISDEQKTMRLVYRFDSQKHWAEVEDALAENTEMDMLLAEADALGSLREGRMLIVC